MITGTPSSTPSRRRLPRAVAGSAVLLGLALGLSACGGSDSDSPTSSSSASQAPGGQGGQGGQQMQQIQACLKAAGIEVAAPSGAPSGMPSGMPSEGAGGGPGGGTPPSGMPSGAAPSGAPSGGPGGGRGGGGVDFSDTKVQAALKACGITVPTARPSGQPSS